MLWKWRLYVLELQLSVIGGEVSTKMKILAQFDDKSRKSPTINNSRCCLAWMNLVDSTNKQKTHPKHKFDSKWVGKPMQTHENYDANIWISVRRRRDDIDCRLGFETCLFSLQTSGFDVMWVISYGSWLTWWDWVILADLITVREL